MIILQFSFLFNQIFWNVKPSNMIHFMIGTIIIRQWLHLICLYLHSQHLALQSTQNQSLWLTHCHFCGKFIAFNIRIMTNCCYSIDGLMHKKYNSIMTNCCFPINGLTSTAIWRQVLYVSMYNIFVDFNHWNSTLWQFSSCRRSLGHCNN